MGSKGGGPQPIDPYQSAQAQYIYGTKAGDYNAALNRVNTQGPGGDVSYKITGHDPKTGAPIYTQTTNLNKTGQQIFDTGQTQTLGLQNIGNSLLKQYGGELANPESFLSGVKGVNQTFTPTGIAASGDAARKAAYAQEKQYLDPQYGQEQEQLDAKLRNQGAHPGDPAYDNAMKLFTNQKQQAYESAFNNAEGQGLAAQNQMYGQQLQGFQAGNAASGQAFSQGAGRYDLLSHALAQLRSGGTNAGNTGSTGSSSGLPPGQANVAAPDVQSAFNQNYQGRMNNYNADVATANSNTAAGASILAAYLAFLA